MEFPWLSPAVSPRQGSRCWVLWVAVRCWGNCPNWRLRLKPNSPWKSWPRGLRTWHMVRLWIQCSIKQRLIQTCKNNQTIWFHVKFFLVKEELSPTERCSLWHNSALVCPSPQTSSALAIGATRAALSPCWSGNLRYGVEPLVSRWAWALTHDFSSAMTEYRWVTVFTPVQLTYIRCYRFSFTGNLYAKYVFKTAESQGISA